MPKGSNPFYNEDAEQKVTLEAERKAEMFAQDDDSELRVEPKSEKVPMFFIEPSLKERMTNYLEKNDIKQSVFLRAAIREFLEKRGL